MNHHVGKANSVVNETWPWLGGLCGPIEVREPEMSLIVGRPVQSRILSVVYWLAKWVMYNVLQRNVCTGDSVLTEWAKHKLLGCFQLGALVSGFVHMGGSLLHSGSKNCGANVLFVHRMFVPIVQ